MSKKFQWRSRHTVLSILCVGSIVSFMDRVAMPVAIPYIALNLHLNSFESGLVLSVFFASYSLSQIPGGLLVDRFGIRRVSTLALLWWAAFVALTGAVANYHEMLLMRVLFGVGEGVFQISLFKAIPVWFPRKERATANAIRLSSSPLGAAIAPLVIVGVMSVWGWRTAFYCLLFPGVLVAALFWLYIRDTPSESSRVSLDELTEIEEDDAVGSVKWGRGMTLLKILTDPTVVKCFFVLFFTDIAFWGFTSWLPTYLVRARGFSMSHMGVAASLPLFAGVLGSVLGGWVSERYFSENRNRPIIMAQLLSALFLYMMFSTRSEMTLVICQTLAGLCMTFIITAFWAIPMNAVPKTLMGVAGGVINMGGQTAAFLAPTLIGYLVGVGNGSYECTFILLIASLLLASGVAFLLPRTCRRLEGTSVWS